MANENIKIVPRAANAFLIEVYNYLGKLVYVLRIHSDGEKLQILPMNAKGEPVTLTGISGYHTDKQEKIDFSVLTIQPKVIVDASL